MADLVLRPYQQTQFDAVRAGFRRYKRIVISAATGTGKTILIVFVAHSGVMRGGRVLVLVNTDELVRQTVEKFNKVGIQVGVVKQARNSWQEQIVVASVQTLSRPSRLQQIPQDYFRMIVVDECHFANSDSYQRIFSHFSESYMLGVSATLFRGDRQSLARAGWQYVAHVYPIEDGIRDGYLVPPRALRIEVVDNLDGVKETQNAASETDFDEAELAGKINSVQRNSTIVDTWLARAAGRRTVCFCVTVEHAFDLANAFRARGVDARVVHGDMPLADRRELLEQHKSGVFPVLCNCAVLTHGYDDPSVSCIVMARPTKSKTLFVQCVGRGLRPCAEDHKVDCLVLDFVDVSTRHKLITTMDVVQLQKEMSGEKSLEPAESDDTKPLVPGEIHDPTVKIGRKTFGNEQEAELWRAHRADILQKKEDERQRTMNLPATHDQKIFLLVALKNIGWPERAAKNVVFGEFGKTLTREGVRKFLGRAKHGLEAPEKYL